MNWLFCVGCLIVRVRVVEDRSDVWLVLWSVVDCLMLGVEC